MNAAMRRTTTGRPVQSTPGGPSSVWAGSIIGLRVGWVGRRTFGSAPRSRAPVLSCLVCLNRSVGETHPVCNVAHVVLIGASV